jgi:diguanylate cyclase (GGDEF)-like protein
MKTILVIEDEKSIRSNIVRILHFGNFQVLEAPDGQTGVDMAKSYLPDLIVCDIMMPGLDGYQVFRELSEQAETAIIPFVFLSAKADRTEIRHGMSIGADDYLTKPFTSAELLQAVTARLTKQVSVTEPYVNEMKRAATNLSQVAYTDPLTNLPNRILLRHRLGELLRQARQQQSSLAVFSLNICKFRQVNSLYGQSTGDMLLKAVADRLNALAENDRIVARMGSNEFCILWTDVLVKEDVQTLATQIIQQIQQPYLIGDHSIDIRVCLGVSIYPQHADNPDTLLARSETAQHWCQKVVPATTYKVYDPVMTQTDREQKELEIDLRHAIAHQEFDLHYQPQVNVITGRLMGVEALLRWQHPTRGLVPTDQVIAIAEETGLITQIGEWVFSTAARHFKEWQQTSLSPLKLAINLSFRQLQDDNLIQHLTQVIADTEINAASIMLELTETSLMSQLDSTKVILEKLTALGISIAIDDFGIGYTSLAHLKHLPINLLKIDQSFVGRINIDKQDAAIVTAIIAMAQSLGLRVIAEGVETRDQLSFLSKQGCYAIQGYICCPPVPADQIPCYLERTNLLET